MPFLRLDGTKLRRARLVRGLSQAAIGAEHNIDRRAIGRAEAGKRVTLWTARVLFKVLNIHRTEDFIIEVIDDHDRLFQRRKRTKGGNRDGAKSKRRR